MAEKTKKKVSATKVNSDSKSKKLYRSESDKVIAGVAAGLAEYFNLDPALMRLIFVLTTLVGGPGLLVYIIMWIVIPSESNVK